MTRKTRKTRWLTAVLTSATLAGALVGSAAASDHPVAGMQLTVRERNGKSALNLVLKDNALPVPAPGSPDDPSLAGIHVTLLSRATGERAFYSAGPGTGHDSWRVRSTPSAVTYAYRNGTATPFGGDIQTVAMRTGAVLKIRSKAGGLLLDGPQGAVGVRVEYGSVRVCALFDGDAVRKDGAGVFNARNADTAGLTDCDNATLLGCPPEGCPGEQQVFCGDGPVTPSCSSLLGEAACSQEGGCWLVTPFYPTGICNCPTLDAGTPCAGPLDCEGLCVAPEYSTCELQESGACSATRTILDCVCIPFMPGGFYPICIDH